MVSRTLKEPPHPETELAHSLDHALNLLKTPPPGAAAHTVAYVVGGGELYAAALPTARALHLTELDDAVEGDAYFPKWDRSQWRVAEDHRHERDDRHAIAFNIRTYVRP